MEKQPEGKKQDQGKKETQPVKNISFNFEPYKLEWEKVEMSSGEKDEKTPEPQSLVCKHHSGVPNIMHIPSHIWSWDSIQDDYEKVS